MRYLYIIGTIIFTVYGQLIIKWRINKIGPIPDLMLSNVSSLMVNIFDFYILSGLFSAFIASLLWMAALTKFELNYAYPFMSLSFVIVAIASEYILGEQLMLNRMFGIIIIIIGIVVLSRS